MGVARGGEGGGGGPGTRGRIVQLCTGETATIIVAARNEYLAIGQQRGRVGVARGGEGGGGGPGTRGRVVQLRAGEVVSIGAARNEHLAVGQ